MQTRPPSFDDGFTIPPPPRRPRLLRSIILQLLTADGWGRLGRGWMVSL